MAMATHRHGMPGAGLGPAQRETASEESVGPLDNPLKFIRVIIGTSELSNGPRMQSCFFHVIQSHFTNECFSLVPWIIPGFIPRYVSSLQTLRTMNNLCHLILVNASRLFEFV